MFNFQVSKAKKITFDLQLHFDAQLQVFWTHYYNWINLSLEQSTQVWGIAGWMLLFLGLENQSFGCQCIYSLLPLRYLILAGEAIISSFSWH